MGGEEPGPGPGPAKPALDGLPPDSELSEEQTFNSFGILLFWLSRHVWPTLVPRLLTGQFLNSELCPIESIYLLPGQHHTVLETGFSKTVDYLAVPLSSSCFKGCHSYWQILMLS